MRRGLLISNPNAGSGAGAGLVSKIVAAFAAVPEPWTIEHQLTAGPGAATGLARAAALRGDEAVFVLGGDGSVREAAAGLLGSNTALGVLPAGTTNVVAGALGLPGRPLAAARVLATAVTRQIDLGLAATEPFLMQFSCGLDAAVMAGLDPRLKRRLGRVGVALAGLEVWWSYDFPTYHGHADGEPFAARGVVVANLAEYAGPFRITPAARTDDRRLDLLLWYGHDRAGAVSFAFDLARGTHVDRADVEIRVVEQVTITGVTNGPRSSSPRRDEPPAGGGLLPGNELLAQLDGDARRWSAPVVLGVASERLVVLVPARAPS